MRKIIVYMDQNIFNAYQRIDVQIRSEVPFFKRILEENINNNEVFHGYVNKINEVWGSILNKDFKTLISAYNHKYDMFLLKQLEKQKEMFKMANEYDAKILLSELDDLSFSDIDSITKGLKLGKISKKRPSKRRKLTKQ
tara:strand:+ start:369 stop:785 length:417 start_codon:yes stop_codon:yes gene_type:complete